MFSRAAMEASRVARAVPLVRSVRRVTAAGSCLYVEGHENATGPRSSCARQGSFTPPRALCALDAVPGLYGLLSSNSFHAQDQRCKTEFDWA